MISIVTVILFVMLVSQLIGKILVHYFPESGIRFDAERGA